MAAAIGTGGKLRRGAGGNRFRSGAGRGGSRRIRPGRALVWLMGLGLAASLVAALSVGLLMGFRWLTVTPFFALGQIEVTGNSRLSAQEIVSLAGVELGANTLDLRIADVERRVAANPWTRRVAVRRVLPSGLWPSRWSSACPPTGCARAAGSATPRPTGSIIAPVEADRFTACPLLDVDPASGMDLASLAGRLGALDGAGAAGAGGAGGLGARAARAAATFF